MHPLTSCMAVAIYHHGISTFSTEGAGHEQPFLRQPHARDTLCSLWLLLILLCCLFATGQNLPSKVECQCIGALCKYNG